MTKGTVAAPESLKTTLMIQSKHDMARYPSIQQKPPIYGRKTFGTECDEALHFVKTTLLLNQTTPHTTKSADLIAHQQTVDDRVGFFAPANSLRCHTKTEFKKIAPAKKKVDNSR